MKHLSLDGNWHLKITGRKRPIIATIPGCIHTDLMFTGILKDPLYRDNIAAGRVNVTGPAIYEREFVLNPIPEHERIFLRFCGIDTLAEVTVNGKAIGRTDNMFHQWSFDITSVAQAGKNTVSVTIDSVLPTMAKADARHHLECATRPGEPDGRTYVRKRKIDFGSDYSPSIPTLGIWRSVYVDFANCAMITHVIPHQHTDGDAAFLEVDVGSETFGPVENLNFYGRVLHRNTVVAEAVTPVAADGSGTLHLKIKNPQLWWPNGMGEQPLYELQVELVDVRKMLDFRTRRFGIRTFRIERGDGKDNPRFRLYVNNVPMLLRGATWTTPDLFASRPTRVEYARLVKSANVSNMNMLRVTGDGIYEPDYFYDLCDEYGMCVWQDFMFSDAAYPFDDDDFVNNLRREAEDVVSRLAVHTSIAIWCGGDNLLPHVAKNAAEAKSTGKMTRAAYDRIINRLLPEYVSKYAPDIQYLPDSTDGTNVASGSDILRDPQPHISSPAAFYTAFGLPSLPEARRFDTFTLPEDRDINSAVFKSRMTRIEGIKQVSDMMRRYFREPKDFESFIALSQIQQGLVCKKLFEHWRRSGSRFGGALYSRLDENWSGLCESSLDIDGHWKGMQFFARRFFGNILVTGIPDPKNGLVAIYVNNDSAASFKGKVKWRVIDVTGHVWREQEKDITVNTMSMIRVGVLKLTELVNRVGRDRLFVWLRLVSDEGYSPSSDCITLATPKDVKLEDPEIRAEIRTWDDHCYAVTLHAEKPAMWGWLDFEPCLAKFDDNFICIAPGQPIRIRVTPIDHVKLNDFKKGLRIHSVYDTYNH